jgi:hypothetical protein
MSQEPNQHCHEKHYINNENAESIDEASVAMSDYAGVYDGVVRRSDLV